MAATPFPIIIGGEWELPEGFTGLRYGENNPVPVWSAYLEGRCLGEYAKPSQATERIEEAQEESNYEYIRGRLVEHLRHAQVIDPSACYENWPDGLLAGVWKLIEQREALFEAARLYYNLCRDASPSASEAFEKVAGAMGEVI